MNRQRNATGVSVLAHALLLWGAVSLGQHVQPFQPPLPLDFSILEATAGAGSQAAAPAALAGEKQATAPAPPAKQEPVPEPAVKQETPPQPVVKKKPQPPKKKTPKPVKKVVHTPPSDLTKNLPTKTAPTAPQLEAVQEQAAVPQPAAAAPAAAAQGSGSPAAARSGPAHGAGTGMAHGPGKDGAFGEGQLDNPLVATNRAPPAYPPAAKRRNIEGWIKIRFMVDEQGKVDHISILAAKPEGVFEQAVQRSVSHWRFKPGKINGTVVKTMVEQTISFKLEG